MLLKGRANGPSQLLHFSNIFQVRIAEAQLGLRNPCKVTQLNFTVDLVRNRHRGHIFSTKTPGHKAWQIQVHLWGQQARIFKIETVPENPWYMVTPGIKQEHFRTLRPAWMTGEWTMVQSHRGWPLLLCYFLHSLIYDGTCQILLILLMFSVLRFIS